MSWYIGFVCVQGCVFIDEDEPPSLNNELLICFYYWSLEIGSSGSKGLKTTQKCNIYSLYSSLLLLLKSKKPLLPKYQVSLSGGALNRCQPKGRFRGI